ncbi:uncharacterized protein LOC126788613 [Argentina anserina]|uniref:uncharacterized protein LOC126788613 n=1 Tax=Argentina anserina TaxID=57926 RepID=UPI0021765232|nr:uncharacterized protein LOC126788613 [Potentilla anserina]
MAMTEEFQEAEVIFSENGESCLDFRQQQKEHAKKSSAAKKKKKMGNSVPVRIPNQMFDFRGRAVDGGGVLNDFDDDERYYKDEGEIVPPHMIVRRRVEGKMAFSVCTGNGRTLKGRDLSQVRNSILRMTGFLEA